MFFFTPENSGLRRPKIVPTRYDELRNMCGKINKKDTTFGNCLVGTHETRVQISGPRPVANGKAIA